MRAILLVIGAALVAISVGWFFTGYLDSALMPALGPAPRDKLALNTLSGLAMLTAAIVGAFLLAWSAFVMISGRVVSTEEGTDAKRP